MMNTPGSEWCGASSHGPAGDLHLFFGAVSTQLLSPCSDGVWVILVIISVYFCVVLSGVSVCGGERGQCSSLPFVMVFCVLVCFIQMDWVPGIEPWPLESIACSTDPAPWPQCQISVLPLVRQCTQRMNKTACFRLWDTEGWVSDYESCYRSFQRAAGGGHTPSGAGEGRA